MELFTGLYFAIGFLIGLWRLSYITNEEDSSMACVCGIFIVVLWPFYLIYKLYD